MNALNLETENHKTTFAYCRAFRVHFPVIESLSKIKLDCRNTTVLLLDIRTIWFSNQSALKWIFRQEVQSKALFVKFSHSNHSTSQISQCKVTPASLELFLESSQFFGRDWLWKIARGVQACVSLKNCIVFHTAEVHNSNHGWHVSMSRLSVYPLRIHLGKPNCIVYVGL